MNFKKWVKSIQTAGYNGARTVVYGSFGQNTVHLISAQRPARKEKIGKNADHYIRKAESLLS